MAYRTTHLPAHRFAVVEMWGEVTVDQIAGAMSAAFGAEVWQAGWNLLWDVREVARLVLDIDDIERIGRVKESFADARRSGVSAVVVRRAIEEEMAILIARYRETTDRTVKTFESMDEACGFLGVSWPLHDGDAIVTAHALAGDV